MKERFSVKKKKHIKTFIYSYVLKSHTENGAGVGKE
jgi:hypothetical protein